MRPIISIKFLILLLYVAPLGFASDLKEQDDSYIKVTAHNVGQGNCITAELYTPQDKDPLYLLMDAGSSSYKKELACQKYFLSKLESMASAKVEEKEEKDESTKGIPQSPVAITSSAIPNSELRDITPGEATVFGKKKLEGDQKGKDEMINEIRISLGSENGEAPINLMTFFISHPDSDHYKLALSIFKPKDKIQNIVLGGLPAKYSQKFRIWLQKQIRDHNTRIYFPALLVQQPIKVIESVVSNTCDYAPQMFSDHIEGWHPRRHLKEFEQALLFNDYIKIYLLSVNPTHWKEEGKSKVQRACLEDDDNSDSLVIKLQIGQGVHQKSFIITGDATNITTDRIVGNYEDNPEFLKCTAITADHHGAKTHGSNNLRWIKATAPQHVIFSCGTMHGHPSPQAYTNFKESPALLATDSHEIWVWEVKGKDEDDSIKSQSKGRKAIVHKTYRSLFSTFSNGTISLSFPLTGEIEVESDILSFASQASSSKRKYTTLKEPKDKEPSLEDEEPIKIKFKKQEINELRQSFDTRKPKAPARDSTSSPYQPPRSTPAKRRGLKDLQSTTQQSQARNTTALASQQSKDQKSKTTAASKKPSSRGKK